VSAVAPCYMCGGELEPRPKAAPGSPYPYRCPGCGGQCAGWFAADGSEYCDCHNDDLDGRPPWDPDYDGMPPPRSEWAVKSWAELPTPETLLCRGCTARLRTAIYLNRHVLCHVDHETGCPELARWLQQLLTSWMWHPEICDG
jgi:hypothetical protein